MQNRIAINRIVIPKHPVVPNPQNILSAIPVGCSYYSVIDSCSAFFSIPAKRDRNTYLFSCGNITNLLEQ